LADGASSKPVALEVDNDNLQRCRTPQDCGDGSATETLVYNALGKRINTSDGASGTVLYWNDEDGHLLREYDGSGTLIEETVWLGDVPVATLRPSGATVAVYYVHTDQLNTPRQVTRPSDNTQLWTWLSDPFGTDAANANTQGVGPFPYNLRFAGQDFDGQAGLHENYFRDYDPATGRYVESDPARLAASINTYAYVDSDPLLFFDPDGRGKEGGQRSIGGNDPAMPRSIDRNSSQEEINQAIRNAEAELKKPGINPERRFRIRGWIKWVKRGFTRSACPPLLEELAIGTARELCAAGDQTMCQVFQMLGGEIDVPGT
jgi:RHS repeat-associated protein